MYHLGQFIALPHLSLPLAAAQTACISFFRTQKTAHTLPLQNSMTVSTAAAEMAPNQPPAATAADGDVPPFLTGEALDAHVERAWAHFRSLGSPKWHVAPMVDQSELPFRMLCRAHGAQAAYTPMLHARLFLEHKHYRAEHLTTCQGDRPLFVQFCANDPEIFVASAALVQDQADYIDLNLGCPQRIAKRGFYGAFLMDHQQLVAQLVSAAAQQLRTPVSVKIRLFPQLQDTISYARMLQQAGASLLAIHGRTRDMKDHAAHRADWEAIAAVRAALRIPVLANGDVRCLAEARMLMDATGADGVMSAEPLLINPMLFDADMQPQDGVELPPLEGLRVCQEYLQLCEQYPTHLRMVRGHVHKLITGWLGEYPEIRGRMHQLSGSMEESIQQLRGLVSELQQAVAASGRDKPIPKLPERKLKALEREAAKAAAIAEQEREAAALAEVEAGKAAAAAAAAGGSGAGQQQQVEVGRLAAAAAAAAAGVGGVDGMHEMGARGLAAPAAKRQAVASTAGS